MLLVRRERAGVLLLLLLRLLMGRAQTVRGRVLRTEQLCHHRSSADRLLFDVRERDA